MSVESMKIQHQPTEGMAEARKFDPCCTVKAKLGVGCFLWVILHRYII